MNVREKVKYGNVRPYLPFLEEDEDDIKEKENEMREFYEDWAPVDLAENKSKKAPKVGYLKPEMDRR